MALAFLVNIPFLFNNLHVIYFISNEQVCAISRAMPDVLLKDYGMPMCVFCPT